MGAAQADDASDFLSSLELLPPPPLVCSSHPVPCFAVPSTHVCSHMRKRVPRHGTPEK